MLHNLFPGSSSTPRLDLTLVAFAAAGLVVATLMPPRTVQPANQVPGDKSYAFAIASGDAMTLAKGPATVSTTDAGSRVLACRHVVSVGPLDIGQRCKPSATITLGAATAD